MYQLMTEDFYRNKAAICPPGADGRLFFIRPVQINVN